MRRHALTLVLVVVAITISVDRLTKHLAVAYLKEAPKITFFSDTIRLQYVENEGAFLGLGSRLSHPVRFWVFTIGNGALLLWIALWIWRNRSRPQGDTLGLSLIWSGGVSNFVDRIVENGRVVDFLNLGIGPVRTGIFNAADVAIVAGLALLVLCWTRRDPRQKS